jgi:TolA-binding protein
MTKQLTHIERIDAYLLHKMSKEEEEIFERDLQTNVELAEEFAMLTALIDVMKENDRQILKEKLQNKANKTKNLCTNRRFTAFRIAAMLIFVLGIAALLRFTVFNKSSHEKLAMEYKIKDPGTPVLMSNSTDKAFNKAMSLYQQENYAEAEDCFAQLLKSKPKNDTILFYKAISAFENSNYTTAIQDFEQLVSLSNSAYQEKARYWLGLSYLATNQLEKAKPLFARIAQNPQASYSEKAAEILKEDVFN